MENQNQAKKTLLVLLTFIVVLWTAILVKADEPSPVEVIIDGNDYSVNDLPVSAEDIAAEAGTRGVRILLKGSSLAAAEVRLFKALDKNGVPYTVEDVPDDRDSGVLDPGKNTRGLVEWMKWNKDKLSTIADCYGKHSPRNMGERKRESMRGLLKLASVVDDDELLKVIVVITKQIERDYGPHPLSGIFQKERSIEWSGSRWPWSTYKKEDLKEIEKAVAKYGLN
jgi:hypothetical protein